MARPALDAKEGRAGPRPERDMGKILDGNLDRLAAPVHISHIGARRVEEAKRIILEELGRKPQSPVLERHLAGGPCDQPAGCAPRNLRRNAFGEYHLMGLRRAPRPREEEAT